MSVPETEKTAFPDEQTALIARMVMRIEELEAAIGKPKKTSSNSNAPKL